MTKAVKLKCIQLRCVQQVQARCSLINIHVFRCIFYVVTFIAALVCFFKDILCCVFVV